MNRRSLIVTVLAAVLLPLFAFGCSHRDDRVRYHREVRHEPRHRTATRVYKDRPTHYRDDRRHWNTHSSYPRRDDRARRERKPDHRDGDRDWDRTDRNRRDDHRHRDRDWDRGDDRRRSGHSDDRDRVRRSDRSDRSDRRDHSDRRERSGRSTPSRQSDHEHRDARAVPSDR